MLEESQVVICSDSKFDENEFKEAVEKIANDISVGGKKKTNELSLDEHTEVFKNSLNFNLIGSSEAFEPILKFGELLLKGRNENSSDFHFGKWLKENGFDKRTQQQRHRIMKLAEFFENKDFSGISVTSGYIIAKDKYAFVAEDVYNDILGKNLSCERTTEILEQRLHDYNVATGKPLLAAKPKIKKLINPKFLENLETLEDAELANWYLQIDNQSQLFKGVILLEGRRRYPSHKEFGEWVHNQGL